MKKFKTFFGLAVALVLMCSNLICAFAHSVDALPEGTYEIKSELSCYINAMGGVEFGTPLLDSSELNVSSNGEKSITMHLTKSSVTIYSITCDVFIDSEPAGATDVGSGTIGYYDENGSLITQGVDYTLSDDTAENSQHEQVHFVDSITFPVDSELDTYNLTLYINSNVMGTQFKVDGYPATLTVDWESLNVSSENMTTTSIETTAPITAGAADDENVESMDGLNIYHADSDEETTADAEETDTTDSDKTVVVVIAVAAVLLAAAITVFAIKSRKEDKKK